MPVPQRPEKLTQPSLLNAKDVIAQNKVMGLDASPTAAILTYQAGLFRAILKQNRTKEIKGLYGDVRWLDPKKTSIVVVGDFGIGAPAATVVLENLVALGIKQFISIGIAGSISNLLEVGDLVVCSKALRDEGTSHHYMPATVYTTPSETLTKKLRSSLEVSGYAHTVGSSWTTDAPYRETKTEIDHYRQKGIHTVEMEAAALFAVGQFRQVEVAAAFAISDVADESGWRFDFEARAHQKGLLQLFEAAVDTLT